MARFLIFSIFIGPFIIIYITFKFENWFGWTNSTILKIWGGYALAIFTLVWILLNREQQAERDYYQFLRRNWDTLDDSEKAQGQAWLQAHYRGQQMPEVPTAVKYCMSHDQWPRR